MNYIGIDLGGTKILGALFDENGKILHKVKKKTKAKNGIKTIEIQVFSVIDELLDKNKKEKVESIGIGVPGIVNIESGVVEFAPNVEMDQYPIRDVIKKKYKMDVNIGNDVNVGTLGEWRFSTEKDVKNAIGLFIGTGIGGGIIIDNKLYSGSGGLAGEIGHMSIDIMGAVCGCGSRGCLEAISSKTGMQTEILARIRRGEKTLIQDSLDKEGILKSSALKEAYEKQDVVVRETVEKAARYLGVGVANIINIFNPEVIIFGGGIIEELGDVIIPIVKKEALRYTIRVMYENVRFKKAELGDDAGIMGAFILAKEGAK